MSLLNDIKTSIAKSGANKGKIIYFKENQKTRIRFLNDVEDGMKVTFHDSFEKGINVPCQEIFGKDCPYCGDDTLRTRDQYIWSIYDIEANEVKLLMAPVNNCSPIPHLISMYEAYDTLLDRDYVITKIGKQQNTTYTVIPMDKSKFRNAKAKPFSESAILKILNKAFPVDDVDDEDEEEENNKKKKAKSKKKVEEDDYDNIDEENDEQLDYEEMSALDLFKLCKERGIICDKKKPAKYYIKLLEHWDEYNDEDDNEEEWDED